MDTNNSTRKSFFEGNDHGPDTSQSILILVAFFIVISTLFGLGMGCSYICYRRALKKRKERDQMNRLFRAERERQNHPYRAIASIRPKRGIPNWYAPNPKDENSHLLDVTIIPVQVQSQP